jgi:tetratricopeptide (TPR) repeat protein
VLLGTLTSPLNELLTKLSVRREGSLTNYYLLRRQQDPRRLRRLAMEEFISAWRTNRLVAVTGSYATENLGYPSWGRLIEDMLKATLGKSPSALGKSVAAFSELRDPRFDNIDVVDLAELLSGIDRHFAPAEFSESRARIAKKFQLTARQVDLDSVPNVTEELVRTLNIRRFVTLNYDLEIEWSIFLNEHEKSREADGKRAKAWKKLDAIQSDSGRIVRPVPTFGLVQSESLCDREASGLFDFAIGKNGFRARILHLHGRADQPSSLVISRRDYRDRYWRAGLAKLPFEYGIQTIFAGNPILFVGIGMSERELTKALEQMLSDNPNRRSVPMFILWNGKIGADGKVQQHDQDALRLLFYRKYGVHTLFDLELANLHGRGDYLADLKRDAKTARPFLPKGRKAELERKAENAERMAESVSLLASSAGKVQSYTWKYSDFRNPQTKLDAVEAGKPLTLWEYEGRNVPEFGLLVDGELRDTAKAQQWIMDCLASGHAILPIIGQPGSGRGALVRVLRDTLVSNSRLGDRIVTVSGSFVSEMDSLFSILSGAWDGRSAFSEGMSRTSSIAKLRADIGSSGSSRLTIVIAGMERFIAHDGSSLSTELDMLVRIISRLGTDSSHRFRLILVGSPRLMRYLAIACPDACRGAKQLSKTADGGSVLLNWGSVPSSGVSPALRQKTYFEVLRDRFKIEPAERIRDSSVRRREFLARITDRLSSESEHDPRLLIELLRILAFIGQPTEETVLRHAPSLRGLAGEDASEKIANALEWLKSNDLVLPLRPYPSSDRRVGLHKAMITEIRQRHGVPVSDARLAAGFNVGLFVAQPVDSIVPDQEWHQELGQLVDGLIGQFHEKDASAEVAENLLRSLRQEEPGGPRPAPEAELEQFRDGLRFHFLDEYGDGELARMASSEQSHCLRAALSLMRSYFSTPALLMAGNRGMDPWVSDGPLTDHAKRLSRIIRKFQQVSFLRDSLRTFWPEKQELVWQDEIGHSPFYADDLAWLYNELGVVLLTQGRLYEASDALGEAEKLNEKFVEFGERHQNWRRISLNRVQLLIDMGRIEQAEELLRDIETATSTDAGLLAQSGSGAEGKQGSFRDYVLEHYSDGSAHQSGSRLDAAYPTDLILAEAMVIGYEGICHHLRGALEPGLKCLTDATSILSQISEQRAYAHFQKHRASILGQMKNRDEAIRALRLCTAAAGPSRQTDIDHSGRISLAEYGITASSGKEDRPAPDVIPQLRETLRYALDSDMYRLQLEAMQNRSLVHLQNGDAETALRFATDALAIACRHGFGLRKVSLRILLGKILAARHDVLAARRLLTSASKIATSMRYARAVAAAEDCLVGISEEEGGRKVQ